MKENLQKSKADHLLDGLTYKEIKKFNKVYYSSSWRKW